MLLSVLSELAWKLYSNGKPKANKQNLTKGDIAQEIKLQYANAMRQLAYQTRATMEGQDYYFVSPLLSIKVFELGAPDARGGRRVDMSAWDVYRLPYNSHFTNVTPVAGDGCGDMKVENITQVNTGEENFYINDPDMAAFKFYVVKGRGIVGYNIPPCVKKLEIEATYDITDDGGIDIPMDIAKDIIDQVLGINLGIKKQYYSEEAQKQMAEQNIVK